MSAGISSGARFISVPGCEASAEQLVSPPVERISRLCFDRGIAKQSNLFHVMKAMHQMKLSPLRSRQRPENGMV